jgi:hypothetical protein
VARGRGDEGLVQGAECCHVVYDFLDRMRSLIFAMLSK